MDQETLQPSLPLALKMWRMQRRCLMARSFINQNPVGHGTRPQPMLDGARFDVKAVPNSMKLT